MLPEERRQKILESLEDAKVVSIQALSDKLNVSEMTIRRDLGLLEEEQLLKRTRGGALVADSFLKEPQFEIKLSKQSSVKETLAHYAATKFVNNDEVIILEGGTTVSLMAKFLKPYRNLTMVTNGLHTLNALQDLLPYNSLICPGGILRENSQTFVGPITERYFQEFHAMKLFLSATGYIREAGFTDPNMLETQVKHKMIQSAAQKIVLFDSTKFGIRSLSPAFSLSEIDILITDEAIPDEFLAEFEAHSIKVIKVPKT
jgi:DeoR/GlpR family transcriptional regulator of sugar metabolism